MNPDRIAVTEEVRITEKKQLPLAATETSNTVSFPSPASSVCSVSGKGVWWLLVFCSLLVVVLLCPCLCLHLLSVRDSKVGGGGPRSADLVERSNSLLLKPTSLSLNFLLRLLLQPPLLPFFALAVIKISKLFVVAKKSEGNKKRKTKAASEDHVPLQVVTTKEDAKTKLAEDSSMMMERSLQVQPSVENSLLSMQDSIDSPDKGGCAIHDSAFASTPPMTASDIVGICRDLKMSPLLALQTVGSFESF
ncbi:cyclin-A2-2 [Trifolium repens]|nr:cyclin-A2-2 [Trifolium repens]